MAINRYDQPAQVDYENTYVPIPFNEMLQIGQMTAQRQEQGENLMNDYMNRLSDFPVAPGADEKQYQDLLGTLDTELQGILEGFNPGSPEFSRKVRKVMTTQARDPKWRMLRQNYEPYWDAVKTSQENQGLPSANKAGMEEYIRSYKEKGAQEMGNFQAPGVIPYFNYQKELEDIGRGFKTAGITQQFFNEDGTIDTTIGETGVYINEVAQAYGYEYDKEDNSLSLKYIPESILLGEAGVQLKLEAQELSRLNGEDPGTNLQALYEETTRPLVDKYAGLVQTQRRELTKLGQDKLEGASWANSYLGSLNETVGSVIGSSFGAEGVVGKALALAPAPVRKLFEKVFKNSEIKEGVDIEEVMSGIDQAFDAIEQAYNVKKEGKGIGGKLLLAGSMGKASIPYTGLRGLLAGARASLRETTKYAFYSAAPGDNLSEDDLAIAIKVKNAMGIKKPWEELSKEEKSSVWKEGANYVKDFYDTGVHVATTPVNSKTKTEASKVMFGLSSDDGKVTGGQINGPSIEKKIINPQDPSKELTLKDILKKDDVVEYVGRTSYDNPYGPGLHTIMANGKPYYMYWSEQDKAQDAIPYALHDFKRNAAGIGTWFQQGDYFFRGGQGEEGEEYVDVLTEEEFTKAQGADLIETNSDGSVRGTSKEATRINAGQGQGVMAAYYKFLEEKGLLK